MGTWTSARGMCGKAGRSVRGIMLKARLVCQKRADKEDRTDSVAQQLRELHKDKYSGPQLRLRARMKVNGKNDSIDSPPSISLFCGVTPTKIAKGNSLSEALTSAATAVVSLLKETPEPTCT